MQEYIRLLITILSNVYGSVVEKQYMEFLVYYVLHDILLTTWKFSSLIKKIQ